MENYEIKNLINDCCKVDSKKTNNRKIIEILASIENENI
jgi:hypothetical protein